MNYWMPKNKKELMEALKYKDESTYLCAGATDLMIHLRSKKILSYSLIDLTHYQKLKTIEETENDLIIGALATMSQLEVDERIKTYLPALGKAASMVGSVQIRNLATIGGNIGNASQSADTVPVLFAHDARAVIMNEKGKTMEKPLISLISEEGKIILGEKEVIIYIKIKKDNVISAFTKVGSRKAVTISKVNGCIKMSLRDDTIENVTVYLGAVGAHPLRAPHIEEALIGKKLSGIMAEEQKAVVQKELKKVIEEEQIGVKLKGVIKPEELQDEENIEEYAVQKDTPYEQHEETMPNVQKEIFQNELKEAVKRQIEVNIPDRPSKHYKKSAALGCILNMLEELQEKGGK